MNILLFNIKKALNDNLFVKIVYCVKKILVRNPSFSTKEIGKEQIKTDASCILTRAWLVISQADI